MVKTAFSTLSCPDWSFREMIEYGTRFGFDGVEVRLVARETDLLRVPDFQAGQRAQSRKQLSDAGFQLRGLSSSVRFHDAEKSVRDEHVETGKRYLDMARDLGSSFVRVFGDIVPEDTDRQTVIEQAAEGLNRLGEYAQTLDLGVVIETHGDFADSRIMQDTMNLVQSPAVGVLWDTHHPWRYFGEPLSETVERIGRWVRHTHWKDSISQSRQRADDTLQHAATQAHQLMSGHRHADYVLFRGGEFPALECMRHLRETGYDGWHCLEWEKMWHPDIEDPEVALPLFPAKIRELWELAASGAS